MWLKQPSVHFSTVFFYLTSLDLGKSAYYAGYSVDEGTICGKVVDITNDRPAAVLNFDSATVCLSNAHDSNQENLERSDSNRVTRRTKGFCPETKRLAWKDFICNFTVRAPRGSYIGAVVEKVSIPKSGSHCQSYLKINPVSTRFYTYQYCGDNSVLFDEEEKSGGGICAPQQDAQGGERAVCPTNRLFFKVRVSRKVLLENWATFRVVVTKYDKFARCPTGQLECWSSSNLTHTSSICISASLACDGFSNCGPFRSEDEPPWQQCAGMSNTEGSREDDFYLFVFTVFAFMMALILICVCCWRYLEKRRQVRRPQRQVYEGQAAAPEIPALLQHLPPVDPTADRPPSYDALFPEGPPADFSNDSDDPNKAC